MAGENIDVTSDPAPEPEEPKKRNFLGVQFDCCGVYARIYANKEGTAYMGNCPKCAKKIKLSIGPGGSDSRFFTAR